MKNIPKSVNSFGWKYIREDIAKEREDKLMLAAYNQGSLSIVFVEEGDIDWGEEKKKIYKLAKLENK